MKTFAKTVSKSIRDAMPAVLKIAKDYSELAARVSAHANACNKGKRPPKK